MCVLIAVLIDSFFKIMVKYVVSKRLEGGNPEAKNDIRQRHTKTALKASIFSQSSLFSLLLKHQPHKDAQNEVIIVDPVVQTLIMKFLLFLIVALAASAASLPSPRPSRDIRSFRGGGSLTNKVASNLLEQSIKDVKASLMVWGWKDIVFASLAVLAGK